MPLGQECEVEPSRPTTQIWPPLPKVRFMPSEARLIWLVLMAGMKLCAPLPASCTKTPL
jgi:hypothetical protein